MLERVEKIIKKKWCFSYCMLLFLSFLIESKQGLIFPAKDLSILLCDYVSIKKEYLVYFISSFYCFLVLSFYWMVFYFPYVKKGLKFLAFTIMIQLISFPFIIMGCFDSFRNGGFSINFVILSANAVFSVVFVYWSIYFLIINSLYKYQSNTKKYKIRLKFLKKKFI